MDPISFVRDDEQGRIIYVTLLVSQAHPSLSQALLIRATVLDVDQDRRIAAQSELAVFDTMQDSFLPVLKQAEGVILARSLSSSERIWLCYLPQTADVEQALADHLATAHPDRPVAIESSHDPEWGIYFGHFYPTAEEQEEFFDQQVFSQLRTMGADFNEPRNIRQFANFPDKESSRHFRERIQPLALKVFFHGVGKNERWEVHTSFTGRLGAPELKDQLKAFRQAAFECGGDPEGWDAEVKAPPTAKLPSSPIVMQSTPPPPANWSQQVLEQRKRAYAAQPPARTDGTAIASLILSLVGPFFMGLGSLVAVILGHMSRASIRRSAGRLTGSGLALTGLILGYLGLLLWVGMVASFAFFFTKGYQDASARTASAKTQSFNEARRAFQTKLTKHENTGYPVDEPPPEIFSVVKFPSNAGPLAAYVTPDPADGKKHAAMIWVVGGFDNSIADMWSPADPENDQSATAFREVGLIMMIPSFRGGNENGGHIEGLFGEVDDLLSAHAWLKQQPYVDTSRIYLGGHSTGGTLVLLAAAASNEWRAVFSFGPAENVQGYGPGSLPFNPYKQDEVFVRSPVYWLHNIDSPTFVLEGTRQGNISSLRALRTASDNPLIRFYEIQGGTHFTVLQPVSKVIASLITQDTGPKASISLTSQAVNAAMKQ